MTFERTWFRHAARAVTRLRTVLTAKHPAPMYAHARFFPPRLARPRASSPATPLARDHRARCGRLSRHREVRVVAADRHASPAAAVHRPPGRDRPRRRRLWNRLVVGRGVDR